MSKQREPIDLDLLAFAARLLRDLRDRGFVVKKVCWQLPVETVVGNWKITYSNFADKSPLEVLQ